MVTKRNCRAWPLHSATGVYFLTTTTANLVRPLADCCLNRRRPSSTVITLGPPLYEEPTVCPESRRCCGVRNAINRVRFGARPWAEEILLVLRLTGRTREILLGIRVMDTARGVLDHDRAR